MKKRILCLLISLSLLLCSCGGNAHHADEQWEVILPAALFTDMSEKQIRQEAEDLGALSCTVHPDGTVGYQLNQTAQKNALKICREEVDNVILSLTEGDERVASFLSITYTEDLSRIDIAVDADHYTVQDHEYASAFYRYAAMYGALSGIPLGRLEVSVTFRDPVTRLVLDRTSYRDTLTDDQLKHFTGGEETEETSDPASDESSEGTAP